MDQGDLPLGLFKDTRYYEYFLQLEAGQSLVLYTYGTTEAASTRGEEYGWERLARIARPCFYWLHFVDAVRVIGGGDRNRTDE